MLTRISPRRCALPGQPRRRRARCSNVTARLSGCETSERVHGRGCVRPTCRPSSGLGPGLSGTWVTLRPQQQVKGASWGGRRSGRLLCLLRRGPPLLPGKPVGRPRAAWLSSPAFAPNCRGRGHKTPTGLDSAAGIGRRCWRSRPGLTSLHGDPRGPGRETRRRGGPRLCRPAACFPRPILARYLRSSEMMTVKKNN